MHPAIMFPLFVGSMFPFIMAYAHFPQISTLTPVNGILFFVLLLVLDIVSSATVFWAVTPRYIMRLMADSLTGSNPPLLHFDGLAWALWLSVLCGGVVCASSCQTLAVRFRNVSPATSTRTSVLASVRRLIIDAFPLLCGLAITLVLNLDERRTARRFNSGWHPRRGDFLTLERPLSRRECELLEEQQRLLSALAAMSDNCNKAKAESMANARELCDMQRQAALAIEAIDGLKRQLAEQKAEYIMRERELLEVQQQLRSSLQMLRDQEQQQRAESIVVKQQLVQANEEYDELKANVWKLSDDWDKRFDGYEKTNDDLDLQLRMSTANADNLSKRIKVREAEIDGLKWELSLLTKSGNRIRPRDVPQVIVASPSSEFDRAMHLPEDLDEELLFSQSFQRCAIHGDERTSSKRRKVTAPRKSQPTSQAASPTQSTSQQPKTRRLPSRAH